MAYSAEAVQQLLECSICLERFTQPKLLPCQHTFCLAPCLERLVEGGTLRCPECRAVHTLPGDGPSHFPNNITASSFLDLTPLAGARPISVGSAVDSRAVPQQNMSSQTSHRAATAVTQSQNVSSPASDRAATAMTQSQSVSSASSHRSATAVTSSQNVSSPAMRHRSATAVTSSQNVSSPAMSHRAATAVTPSQNVSSPAMRHRAATAMRQSQNPSRRLAVRGRNVAAVEGADNSPPSMGEATPRNICNQRRIISIGERGRGERQFNFPEGVAVSPLDDVFFVADSLNHRVQVFDNTGDYIMTFGCEEGQGDGRFHNPTGIAVNGSGQVVVSDYFNHRVQIFDSSGNFQAAFGSRGSRNGQFNCPWGVACDNDGFIYVCDTENHRVQVFTSDGVFVRKFSRRSHDIRERGFNPRNVAVSADSKVYVSDTDHHRVQVFSTHGNFLFSFGSRGAERGQMENPTGIAVDNRGFVIVGDCGNSRVQVFHADGRFYSVIDSLGLGSGRFEGIQGLTLLNNGNLVVADCGKHRIQILPVGEKSQRELDAMMFSESCSGLWELLRHLSCVCFLFGVLVGLFVLLLFLIYMMVICFKVAVVESPSSGIDFGTFS